jgi:NitT/TauT family transport system ATP-binding protein
MRQRVSIARAFAVDPEILLCDEPFSSLDEITARDLRTEFVRLVRQSNKTALFITHQINEAMEIGDRVLVFHRPARIAYEARLGPGMTEEAHRSVNDDIMRVLAAEHPRRASGA